MFKGEMHGKNFWLLIVTCVILNIKDIVFGQKYFRSDCCQDYCYSNDKEHPQNKHFATNTAYQLIKGSEYVKDSVIPDCKPTRFWLLSRHGTRLPELEEIPLMEELTAVRNKIIENYEVKKMVPSKGALCSQDIELLKSWTFDKNITVDKPEFLTVQGWNDLKDLARDYQTIFPDLLIPRYVEMRFSFRHTNVQRTDASWKAFVEGLFGEESYKIIKLPKPVGNDTLLLPWVFCPIWKTDSKMVEAPGTEVDQFHKSALMINALSRISTRLGFETPLNMSQVRIMWSTCRYESAWFLDKPSPWCTAFTMDDVDILEYEEDLFFHHKSGYGNAMNPNLPCELIQDMLKHLNGTTDPRVKAYFSHSTMMQLFTVALGLNKDETFVSNSNFNSMKNRKWRTSEFDSFSSNIAAIRYDCSNSDGSSTKVKFFRNQSPLQIDGCNNGLCELSHLLKLYEGYLNRNCTETFCRKGKSTTFKVSMILLIVAVIFNKFII